MGMVSRIMTEPEETTTGKNHLKRASEWEYCRTTYAGPPDVKEMKPQFCYSGDALLVNNNTNKKRGTREVEFREQGEIRNGSDFDQKRVGLDKGKKVAKPVEIIMAGSGDEEGEKRAGIITSRVGSCASHGSISVLGRRRTMEDAVTAAVRVRVGDFESYDFFGVYDGHGGARVAYACRDRLHKLVVKEVEKGKYLGEGKGLGYWNKVMRVCFKKMDEGLMSCTGGGQNGEHGEAMGGVEKTMGSTAAVVLVGEEELVVANCGDSRVVLCRGGVATALSNDHKPDRPDERERVEAAGGKVIDWYGSRVLGVLGTSRSIGDQYLKPFVSSEPEVTVIERSESDEFLVIASDGLWDVVSNELACDIVTKCFDGHIKKRKFFGEFGGRTAAEAAAFLAELAMARGSKDNISVIVVELNSSK